MLLANVGLVSIDAVVKRLLLGIPAVDKLHHVAFHISEGIGARCCKACFGIQLAQQDRCALRCQWRKLSIGRCSLQPSKASIHGNKERLLAKSNEKHCITQEEVCN